MVGGGELLRDEQIYLAHKCANPAQYLPPEALLDEKARALVDRYKPTDVQLQVWDDMCHVGPTLSFTRPAKYMYRVRRHPSAWQHMTTNLDSERLAVFRLGTGESAEDRGRYPQRRRDIRHLKFELLQQ
jgi:hypothetical protein